MIRGRQGHLIDTDVEERHHRQRRDHRQRHDARHDESGPQTEERQRHRQNNDDGLEQIDEETPQQGVDDRWLERDDVELDADRIGRPQPVERAGGLFAECGHVAAVAHRDSKHDRGDAGGADRADWWIDPALVDLGQVPEVNNLGAPRQCDHRAPELVDRPEVSRRLDHDPLRAGEDVAAGADGVDALQDRTELERREPQLGELRIVVVDEDPLGLRPVDVHHSGIVDQEQLVAHLVGHRLQLAVRVAVAGQRHQDAEDVVDAVHRRSDDADREVAGHTLHTSPQAIPDRLHLVELVPDVDLNEGHAGLRRRGDEIDLRRLLNRCLDRLGDQTLHAVRAHARTERHHLGNADREPGVLGALHPPVGHHSGAEHDQQGDRRDPVFLDGGARRIQGELPPV